MNPITEKLEREREREKREKCEEGQRREEQA